MEIVSVGRNRKILRDICIVVGSRRSHFYYLAKEFGFLHGFLCPCSCVQVSGFFLQKVVGNHAEFQTCATAKEQNLVSFGNIEQFFHQCFGLIHHRLEILTAMAYLHQGKTAVVKFKARLSRCLNHFAGQYRRSSIEIVLFHNLFFYSMYSLKYQ